MAVSLCAGFNSGQTDAGAESRGCFARALRRSKGDGHPMGDSMAHHGASPVYPPLGNDLRRAELQLSEYADAAARAFISRRSAAQLMAENDPMGRAIRERAMVEARKLGIEITDARVIRLNAHME